MAFEHIPSLAMLVALIILCSLVGLAVIASVYFYCCYIHQQTPSIRRRQSYSLSMKSKNDPECGTHIRFLDPAETMNRSISFEVRNTQTISSSPNLDQPAVFSIGQARPGSETRFLPNWRKLVHVEAMRLPLTTNVDHDVSPGLEESSLESMLRKFDSLVLSFRWADATPQRSDVQWSRDDSLDVFSCRSSFSNSSYFSLQRWGQSLTLSETDIYKSISSVNLDDHDVTDSPLGVPR